jgi:hypothetical protein
MLIISSFRGEQPGKEQKTFTVYINYDSYSIRAEVLKDPVNIHPHEGCTYYWYSSNDIRSTENGFDGKLLHGEYRSFYRDLNLKEQGAFSKGLKTGIWKTWFPGGKIHEIIQYKDGNKNGVMQTFSETGYLESETDYKNGKINGKEVLYKEGKQDTILKYKNGQPVAKKNKIKHHRPALHQRILLHRQKTNDTMPVKHPKDTTAKKPKSSKPPEKVTKSVTGRGTQSK